MCEFVHLPHVHVGVRRETFEYILTDEAQTRLVVDEKDKDHAMIAGCISECPYSSDDLSYVMDPLLEELGVEDDWKFDKSWRARRIYVLERDIGPQMMHGNVLHRHKRFWVEARLHRRQHKKRREREARRDKPLSVYIRRPAGVRIEMKHGDTVEALKRKIEADPRIHDENKCQAIDMVLIDNCGRRVGPEDATLDECGLNKYTELRIEKKNIV